MGLGRLPSFFPLTTPCALIALISCVGPDRARVALSEAAKTLEPGGRPLTREEALAA